MAKNSWYEEHEREAESGRKRRQRAELRDIKIPPPDDIDRRLTLEEDPVKWLSYYMPDQFYQWTDTRRTMAYAIEETVDYGLTKAIAADRGCGKTEIFQGLSIKLILTGKVLFLVLISATGPFAERTLGNIKYYLSTNQRLLADYPGAVLPIQALEGASNRAATQTADGKRTHLKWSGSEIVFPTVENSNSSGAIIMTRGVDGALRGLNYRGRRPDLIGVDDPDTRESAMSETGTSKRIDTIQNDIMGLAGADKSMATIMLNNVLNRKCVGYIFTDPQLQPAWNGVRYPLISTWPDEKDNLWEQYVKMRRLELAKGNSLARLADQFYLDHREQMDAGGEVTNPFRFNSKMAGDGMQIEYSTYHHVFNAVADNGWKFVLCELQCDPPEELDDDFEFIDEGNILNLQGTYTRGTIPNEVDVLVMGVDCGKYFMHWVLIGWKYDGTGWIIDYGADKVEGTSPKVDEGVEFCMQTTLQKLFKRVANKTYRKKSGRQIRIQRILIDRGYKPAAIQSAVKSTKDNRFAPCIGTHSWGAPMGMTSRIKKKPTPTHRPGLDCAQIFDTDLSVRLWETWIMSDPWKHWMRSRLLTTVGEVGSIHLFIEEKEEETDHVDFAVQLADEYWDSSKRKFISKNKNNHFADALEYACVGGSQCGVALLPTEKASKTDEERGELKSLSEIKRNALSRKQLR